MLCLLLAVGRATRWITYRYQMAKLFRILDGLSLPFLQKFTKFFRRVWLLCDVAANEVEVLRWNFVRCFVPILRRKVKGIRFGFHLAVEDGGFSFRLFSSCLNVKSQAVVELCLGYAGSRWLHSRSFSYVKLSQAICQIGSTIIDRNKYKNNSNNQPPPRQYRPAWTIECKLDLEW